MTSIFVGFGAQAQKTISTKEDARLALAKGFVSFRNSLRPPFKETKDLKGFKTTVCGPWTPTMPFEGDNLLNAAYESLRKGTSDEELIKTYAGKEMAAALMYVQKVQKDNPKSDGSELFGGTTGNFNPYAARLQADSPCRWYQLICWLKQIFGEAGAEIIITQALEAIRLGLR
ncbi:MAG: hypothetical protein CFE24_01340 [Flavobacterium sp. BFFFF2]|nr:MAG: hypothetical protein CFE24_01340 [Flavobacterium sp. BFFFF2]